MTGLARVEPDVFSISELPSLAADRAIAVEPNRRAGRWAGGGSAMSESRSQMNPGDEAPPGTRGTGEDVCPTCHGSGKIEGAECKDCGGSGKVTRAIGGA
ncbi:MAG: hypothetical protein JOZ05_08355 [Acetobacteraceae bacterium]|nr:hypothetical protein [Acetobacteraceae bacterium]